MIRIEELSIGNWVEHNGEIIQVKPYHFEVFMNPESQPANAIPLTEELLTEKCGFKRNHYGGLYLYGKFDFDLTKEGYFLVDDVGVHCKHLHQLQNLYFSLTGQELPVNL